MKGAVVGLVLLGAGCGSEPLTEVLLGVDAQAGLRAQAEALEVRVFDHEGAAVLDQSRDLDDGSFPFVVPLVPRDGDVTRTWVVEATLLDAEGRIVVRGRARGGYEAGSAQEGVLCLEDACQGVLCGDSTTCATGECRTCRGEEARCGDASTMTAPVGMGSLECP